MYSSYSRKCISNTLYRTVNKGKRQQYDPLGVVL